ncbi:MAG: diacylglycerol kinase family lipid kinase [Chlamydiales bacterium]|nr:diacylglycerol kinase family lipid kinase [Chlamydiales bacterium]
MSFSPTLQKRYILPYIFKKKAFQPVFLQKKKILFIINPISGTGKQKKIETTIDETLFRDHFEYMTAYTKGPHHASMLAKQAVEDSIDIVVAVGGDGTVNEIAKSLIGSTTLLGIIPTGSGNGLARYLNIPLNLKKAINCINKLQTKKIDTVKINHENFISVAGVGFDATVGMEFSNFGKRGLLSYLKIIVQQLPFYEPKEYQLMIDGRLYKQKAFLICFANSGQYGNNIYIAPGAKIDDGFLDILIFKTFPPHATPKLLIDLINRQLEHSKYIEVIKCKDVVFQQPITQFHIDGEPLVLKEEVNIQIQPQSLEIICDYRNSFSAWFLKSPTS